MQPVSLNEDKNSKDDAKDYVVMEYFPPLSPQIMMECQRICLIQLHYIFMSMISYGISSYESNTDIVFMAEMQDLEEQMDLSDLITVAKNSRFIRK